MGNHFRHNLSFWDVGIFFYWTGLSNFCQSRRMHAHMPGVIVLIGTLSSNQKDVSPFPSPNERKTSSRHAYSHERGYIQSNGWSNMWHAYCQLANWRYALDHLDCSPGAPALFYSRKQSSLPINEGSCWNLPLCKFP